MVSRNYVDGGVYPFADGSERVWYKSPNEKMRPSGFVTEEEFKQLKASQRASVSEADQSKFNAAQVGLQSVNEARQMLARRPPGYSNRVAAMDAGEIDPTWLEAFFRNKGGNPSGWGGQMAQALTPLRNTAFINQIQNIQKNSPTGGGASLGNSIVEGQRLEGAFGSLAVGQDPAALGRTLSNIEGMVKTWQPGLTPANPMDLTAGQSRDTAPRGAFYRSPEGAVRKNISGNAGNPIVWTPESDPQKAYKDAKLAWNDRWFQRRGSLDGANEAFEKWWATAPAAIKTNKKAPPIAPPPRANNAFSGMSNEQVLNLARGK
jgi:hypothetical protein